MDHVLHTVKGMDNYFKSHSVMIVDDQLEITSHVFPFRSSDVVGRERAFRDAQACGGKLSIWRTMNAFPTVEAIGLLAPAEVKAA